MISPTINHVRYSHENSIDRLYDASNKIKYATIFKMVPLRKVVVPVGIDLFLEPLAGALGVFRQ